MPEDLEPAARDMGDMGDMGGAAGNDAAMLSRNAQGLYWMGRYLERAEHLCQLLRLQVEALVDRPLPEIHFGWRRIYTSLGRLPPVGGDLDSGQGDDYTLADSYTLAGDLTFERSNPDSIRSCFAFGRENARQMRHCISAEMWTCLNLAWLRIRDLDVEDIWKVSPEGFYTETARAIDTFAGVAQTTMYRDEGWRFMRLGRFIERAQLRASLLLAQLAATRSPEDGEISGEGWTSLLRACHAFDAYERSHGVEVRPQRVLNMLVTDPLLPGTLCSSLDAAAAELSAIGTIPDARVEKAVTELLAAIGTAPDPRVEKAVAELLAAIGTAPDPRAEAAAKRLAGRLRAPIRDEWADRNDPEALLTRTGEYCRTLHDLVIAAYVDYAVEDPPAR